MNFGTALVAPGARRLLARDFIGGVKDKLKGVVDDVKDFGGDVVDGAKGVLDAVKDGAQDAADAAGDAVDDIVEDVGNTTLDEEVVFDVSVGEQGKRFNIFRNVIRYGAPQFLKPNKRLANPNE